MVPVLPKPVSIYFEANNAHDIDTMLSAFANDAVVHDEGQDLPGHVAIRAWMVETTRKYRPTFSAVRMGVEGDKTIVTTEVAGTFPGSPIQLQYEFAIVGAKIAKLEVHS